MNYEYIEELVRKSKDGDKLSKEKLSQEFRPLIINISKRTFLDEYELQDIQNECYNSLFKCLSLYNLESHKFVAYATNGLKNNLSDLIKRVKTRGSVDGNDALCFCDDCEENLVDENNLEDFLCDRCDIEELRLAINNLNEDEKELIDFVFFKNNTVKTYAYFKNMCYSTAILKKKVTLNKIYKYINEHKIIQCS